MPTVSTTSTIHFTNLGPLTTTFTPPSSCTAAPTTGLLLGDPEHDGAYRGGDQCESSGIWGRPECLPSPSAYADAVSLQSGAWSSVDWPYYSPGNVCPSAWTTVGMAEKYENGTTSMSGIFKEPVTTAIGPSYTDYISITLGGTTTAMVRDDPVPNEFMNAMDNGETAIACCPSGYTGQAYGQCYSMMPLSAYTKDTVCQRFVDPDYDLNFTTTAIKYYGKSVTASLPVWPTDDASISISSSSYDSASAESSGMSVIVYQNLITLVHRGDNPESTRGDDGTGTGEGGSEPTETDNAAAPVGGRKGTVGAVTTIMGIWGIAVLAGALLVVPM